MSLCTTTFTRRWLKRRVGQTDTGWDYDCSCGVNGHISKMAEGFTIAHSEWAAPWQVWRADEEAAKEHAAKQAHALLQARLVIEEYEETIERLQSGEAIGLVMADSVRLEASSKAQGLQMDAIKALLVQIADHYPHTLRVSQGWLWIDDQRSNVHIDPTRTSPATNPSPLPNQEEQ